MEPNNSGNKLPMPLLLGGGLVLVAVVFLLVAGSNSQNSNTTTMNPVPKDTTSGSTSSMTGSATNESTEPQMGNNDNVKTFTVTGSNFSFDVKEIKVNKGDTVRIVFKNADGFHNLVIDEFNVKTNTINGGEQDTIQFVADKTGEFEYYCSVGKHRSLGMFGKLTVM